MKIQLHPSYENLRDWIVQLPNTFYEQGQVIYDARNQIRVIQGPDGSLYNVKRYCCPKWYNRLAYSFIRQPKAIRAYTNAIRLAQRGIPTPNVVAYILCGKGLIRESYLITEQSPLTHMLYELGDGVIQGREALITALGAFAGTMHEKGVLHLDFSPGNVLFDQIDGWWQFTLVDINRMRFGCIGAASGCRNFARLWGGRAMYRLLADGYAAARGLDPEWCYTRMWQAHHRFWKNRSMPKSSFPVVLE